jgi:tetratricopeptide (TPR) repeat protein
MRSKNSLFLPLLTVALFGFGFAVIVFAKVSADPAAPTAATIPAAVEAPASAAPDQAVPAVAVDIRNSKTVTIILNTIDEGRFQEAAEILASVQTRNTSEFWFLSGYLLESQGYFIEAIGDYRRGILLDPKNSKLHFQLGSALYKSSKYDEAIDSFRACVRLDPQNILAWQFAAQAFVAEKQYQRAIDLVNKSIALKLDDPAWYGILKTCYTNLNQYADASDAARKYAELKPDGDQSAVGDASATAGADHGVTRRDRPAIHRLHIVDGEQTDRQRVGDKARNPLLAARTERALPSVQPGGIHELH